MSKQTVRETPVRELRPIPNHESRAPRNAAAVQAAQTQRPRKHRRPFHSVAAQVALAEHFDERGDHHLSGYLQTFDSFLEQGNADMDKHARDLARRGAGLWHKTAKAELDAAALAKLIPARLEADPLREEHLRLEIRHAVALVGNSAVGIVGGVILALVESVLTLLLSVLARFATIAVPMLFTFALTLLVTTLRHSGPIDNQLIGSFLSRAGWNAAIAGLLVCILQVVWLAYQEKLRADSESYGQHETVISAS